ncbi:MAG: Hsp70 family protein [Myxococcota bacterium]|jgi:molecular chaperone DnaK
MDEPIIGIDFGTSYSCVATVLDGKPVVIPNEWGERTHASVVSFLDNGRVLVGNEAKRRIIMNPETTVASAKRLIGRYFFSDEVKKARTVSSYEIIEGPNSGVRVKIRDRIYSLPEIGSFVLREMKQIAENYLGCPVTKAIITVPAFFNDNQRQATRDAGRIAGLEVLRIINEPTAAALAYGFGKKLAQKVAVYDLGGGTFDISILDLGRDIYEVVSTAGDTYLGGDDFDLRIMQNLMDEFKRREGIDLASDRVVLQRVKEASERAKIELSQKPVATILIKKLVLGPDDRPRDLSSSITSDQFKTMCMEFVQRTFKVCDEALQSGRLTTGDIDGVILVGGPTRLPLVHDSVQHYFQQKPLDGINPDEVVATGAAIFGNSLGAEKRTAYLLDVTPMTLRLGTVGGFTEPVIPKNSPLPIEKNRIFTTSRDYQDRVKIRVYQGENQRASDNEALGEFEFTGFRVGLRGEIMINVTFEIDNDGLVNVSATDTETHVKQSATIYLNSGLTEEEIALSAELNKEVQLSRDRDLPAVKQD